MVINIYKKFGIRKRNITVYHPQSNPVERSNRSIGQMLTIFAHTNHKTWDVNLPQVLMALRASPHSTLGFSPYFLNFGKEMNLPGDPFIKKFDTVDLPTFAANLSSRLHQAIKQAKDSWQKYQQKAKINYDKKVETATFEVDDFVVKRNRQLSSAVKSFTVKLAPKWTGPFKIVKKIV